MSIGKKFGLIVAIASILLPLSTIITWRNADKLEGLSEMSRNESLVFALKAKGMQLSVVQVQQWLTDISATRAQKGFDDGFNEAHAQTQIFNAHYKAFQKMFNQENDQNALEQLEGLKSDFDAFYEMGKKWRQPISIKALLKVIN